MKRDVIATALERAGLPPQAAAAKVQLFERCEALASQLGWNSPEHAWWIPGRLEVFGKHTDYAGGRTLVAALPRGVVLLAATGRASLPGVTVADAVTGEIAVSNPPERRGGEAIPDVGDRDQQPAWAHYVEAVVRRLQRNFPGALLSANIVFASDLPAAAGMSSSSALMVGLAAALVRMAGIDSREEWRRNITGPMDEAAYYACIENGATFRSLEGDSGVGTHGGSEDHAAILCGAPAQLTAFAFVPLRLLATVPVPTEWRFVVASSGVHAEKSGGTRDAYNALAREAAALLQIWNTHERAAASLGEALSTGTAAPAHLAGLVQRAVGAGATRDALIRRLTHFVREDGRVPDAIAAFSAGDAVALADLTRDSQNDAELLLHNQVTETVELAAVARRLGAIGASAFGAGFGGSVWAVVEREAAPDFAARWLAACRPACPPGATAFEASPGPPLTPLNWSR
ncbi:MAG: galactokinase [Acidobacteriota bacterium]|nr:galactokinase [Acidobacteriota bacterium]MDQ3417959.1 galactokinase [Acidobacteriota bacterium]